MNFDRDTRSTVVNVDKVVKVRRKHGFIQNVTTGGRGGGGGSGDNLFRSTSEFSTASGYENELLEQQHHAVKSGSLHELGSEAEKGEHGGVGRLFFKRFLKINLILFTSLISLPMFLFVSLILLCLLGEYVIYRMGLVSSQYYKVLGDRDLDGFWMHTATTGGIIVAICIVKSTRDYVAKLLTVTWRQILCQAIHKMYFCRFNHYQLNVLDKMIDNPDQRLTQDVDKFTNIYGDILPKFIIAPFVIAYYSYEAFSKTGWYGPVACFVFFLIGSIVNRFAMLPVVKYVVQQEKREGNFRFIHMLVRVNSESISFQDGSRREDVKANASLDKLVKTQSRLYFRQYILNICINLYDYVGAILSYLILAVAIFSGAYDSLGPTDLSVVISENSFINLYLIYQFSQLVGLSVKLAEMIGLTHRISQMLERLCEFNVIWKDLFPYYNEDNCGDYSKFEVYRQNRIYKLSIDSEESYINELIPAWELQNVSYSSPFRDEMLVSDLTITIYAGQSLLIVGGSSAGKSSLLRILRGLWPPTLGRVKRFYPPGPENAFYCPQKPYLAVGTLREQICFPLQPTDDMNQRVIDAGIIINYLKLLNLNHILDRVGGIDIDVSWSVYESLSPGEIQRLCFLRVFFHKPVLAILDESTSALPQDMEEILYKECQSLGVTTISVAHRESVRKYHDKILILDSCGGWTLNDI